MELCFDEHGEVCYETKSCPACDAVEVKRDELQSEIDDLKTKIEELEDCLP
jgi:hypothetical protein